MNIKALPGKVLAEMIDAPGLFRKKGGVLLKDQDADVSGIRPRWFRVHSVGDGVDWISPDQYVFVAHGRWSNGINVTEDLKLYLLDNEECLAVQDEDPMA